MTFADQRRRSNRSVRCFGVAALAALVWVLTLSGLPGAALALKPIVVDPEQDRLEITTLGDLYEGRGDSIQLETAPSADGATGRMSVNAITAGTNPSWIVFALTNPTERAVERWLTADRYSVVGSGVVWPDLDARRIEAVTPSIGFVPERIPNERADIFRITLEPGQTITYVAELTSDRFARLHLWKPLEYELKTRDRQLFNGVMLGLTALLAIFLTAIFAANHKLIFPAAALVAWCVLGLLCVDFGFFHKLFQLKSEDNAIYRAATEAALAASLVIFLHVFLRLALWHGLVRMLIGTWMLAQLALVAIAVVDPRLASTFARVSFVLIGGVGAALTLFLALRGQDRALSLIPTWLLFCVWTFGAGLVLLGRLPGDVAVSTLVAGLVLILLLIGFTVTQFAFRSLDTVFGAAPSELQLCSLAIDGAGAAVWEWSARRDEMKMSAVVEQSLGLNSGELSAKTEDFCKHLHPTDRDRFRLLLLSMQERQGGKLHAEFRLRHADNSYRWFEFEASSVPSSDGRTPKCVGLVRDVTEAKRSHERLVHDAVHDSLTGLPNRELFLDRLDVAMMRAKSEPKIRPALFLIDIDKFKSVNTTFGIVVGDSLLLTAARRLQRHLGPQDTLARIGGDQFALLFPGQQTAEELASLAERIRRSLRSPVKISAQEIVLTGSVGVAVYDGTEENRHDLLKEAEIAMYRAKRGGADRIEVFRPEMRGDRDDRVAIESDLRKALEKNQLRVLYQPIIYLPTEELAGFEALVRWEHPKHGLMNPAAFVPVAEESDLIVVLGSHVLKRAARDALQWQKVLPRKDRPLFVSVNISSRQLFRPDLIQEIRHILGQNTVPAGTLRLEVTESLVMENPEQAVEKLEWLRAAGADLALDDFGTGYSSLAYLHRLPCDTIKIDRSLMRSRGARDGSAAAIVRSMVALAHELGKKVVAEGVETPDDVAFLRGIGCEYAQGFYYGEPIPDREVDQLLRMVQKSERKLQPRSLFRSKRKKRGAGNEPLDGDPLPDSVPPNGPVNGPASNSQSGENGGSRQPDATADRSNEYAEPPAGAAGARAVPPQVAAAHLKTRQRPMPKSSPGAEEKISAPYTNGTAPQQQHRPDGPATMPPPLNASPPAVPAMPGMPMPSMPMSGPTMAATGMAAPQVNVAAAPPPVPGPALSPPPVGSQPVAAPMMASPSGPGPAGPPPLPAAANAPPPVPSRAPASPAPQTAPPTAVNGAPPPVSQATPPTMAAAVSTPPPQAPVSAPPPYAAGGSQQGGQAVPLRPAGPLQGGPPPPVGPAPFSPSAGVAPPPGPVPNESNVPPSPARVRPVGPVPPLDVSKLPPGIAASLARLAGAAPQAQPPPKPAVQNKK
ncbi:MAG: EAL domain-containing protein [Hyphomicrobium sp.]